MPWENGSSAWIRRCDSEITVETSDLQGRLFADLLPVHKMGPTRVERRAGYRDDSTRVLFIPSTIPPRIVQDCSSLDPAHGSMSGWQRRLDVANVVCSGAVITGTGADDVSSRILSPVLSRGGDTEGLPGCGLVGAGRSVPPVGAAKRHISSPSEYPTVFRIGFWSALTANQVLRWPSVKTSPSECRGHPSLQADLERRSLRTSVCFFLNIRNGTTLASGNSTTVGSSSRTVRDRWGGSVAPSREKGSSNVVSAFVVSGFAGCVRGISESVCLWTPCRRPRWRPVRGGGRSRVRGGCGHGCLKPGPVRLPNRPRGMLGSEVRLSRTDSEWLALAALDVRPGWRICHRLFCRMRSCGLAGWARECGNRIHGLAVERPGPPMRFVRTSDRCNTDARCGRTGRLAEGPSPTVRGTHEVERNIPRSPDRPPIVMNLPARAALRST